MNFTHLIDLANDGNPIRLMPDFSRARCAEDPDAWFRATKRAHRLAKKACGACPVLAECREYSLALAQSKAHAPTWGIWAGMTVPELRKAAGTYGRSRRSARWGKARVAD